METIKKTPPSLDTLLQEYDSMLLELHTLTKDLTLKYQHCIENSKLEQLTLDIENRQRLIHLIELKYQEVEKSIQKWHKKQSLLQETIKSLEDILLDSLQKHKNHFQNQINLEKKFQHANTIQGGAYGAGK